MEWIDKKDKFVQAAQIIFSCKRLVSFTGAGICTDSGIPDYRGIGSSYWMKYNPRDFVFEQFIASEDSRKQYWRMDEEFYELVMKARPNQIHYSLLTLEHLGKLFAIITQNVDGLHQKAGSSPDKIIEIHGNIFTVSCLHCYRKYSRQDISVKIKSGIVIPYCSFCHGILKSDTILFGQPIPADVSSRALMATLQCDLFMVMGSSLLVQPASYLIMKAKEAGAKIIIINLTSTPYDIYADLVIYENAQQAIQQIMEKII
jgi:NAD-dependent deacetylase